MGDALRHDDMPPGSGAFAAENGDQRVAPRFTLLIRAAKLIMPEGEYLCVIRDASETGISLRIFHPLPDTGDMLVELQNGDRYECELVWQDEDRAGLRFKHAADISRIIESPSRFAKRGIRINVEAPATLTAISGSHDATILNISQQGASVQCAGRFSIDQRVKLKAWHLKETNAKVRWRKDDMVGLIFEDTLQYGELARTIQKLRQNGLRGAPR